VKNKKFAGVTGYLLRFLVSRFSFLVADFWFLVPGCWQNPDPWNLAISGLRAQTALGSILVKSLICQRRFFKQFSLPGKNISKKLRVWIGLTGMQYRMRLLFACISLRYCLYKTNLPKRGRKRPDLRVPAGKLQMGCGAFLTPAEKSCRMKILNYQVHNLEICFLLRVDPLSEDFARHLEK